MSAELIDGKAISEKIKLQLKSKIENTSQTGKPPKLSVVLVGDSQASAVYIRNKETACNLVGIVSEIHRLPETTTTKEVLSLLEKLNLDQTVHGILVQLPLPKQIDSESVLLAISPKKDVDGFHPFNMGQLYSYKSENRGCIPCTPKGIMALLDESHVAISGKRCVVIGRSDIVGKPVASLLMERDGTVTICHSKTVDLKAICLSADIIISATGMRNTVTADMVKSGATVIDVGMNRDENGKLCGDVDFEAVKEVAGKITPVPGGVGPMTVAMLMENCYQAYLNQQKV
ncbi:MAG: bifunctional methylenetetrahydrofolate dehydrogenase/methenyltetrahydrofolate cyclohydrolase FolD [Bacillota bacterium]